jgi:hypothetical protein
MGFQQSRETFKLVSAPLDPQALAASAFSHTPKSTESVIASTANAILQRYLHVAWTFEHAFHSQENTAWQHFSI